MTNQATICDYFVNLKKSGHASCGDLKFSMFCYGLFQKRKSVSKPELIPIFTNFVLGFKSVASLVFTVCFVT